MTFLQRLKYQFGKSDTAINKLLLINIAVFGFSLSMVALAFFFKWPYDPKHEFVTNPVLEYFYMPTLYRDIIMRPWTIVTHMFFHAGFWHLLFNMLMLYFMGKISNEYMSNRKIYQLYFFGGVAGMVLSTLAFNFLPVFQDIGHSVPAMGASAAVMSIVIATATLVPNMDVYLYGFIRMKLKWVGVLIVAIDLLSIQDANSGGHIAHIGGALFGFLFITAQKEGWSLRLPGIKFPKIKMSNPFSKKHTFDERDILRNRQKQREPAYHESDRNGGKRTAHQHSSEKPNQEEIDAILDKISQSGYTSLTDHEKEILFRASE